MELSVINHRLWQFQRLCSRKRLNPKAALDGEKRAS